MSKTIKSVKNIPSWFNLKKYEALRTLDVQGWSRQILIRTVVAELLESDAPEDKQEALDWINEIAISPVIAPADDSGHVENWLTRIKRNPCITYSVWPTEILTLYAYAQEFDSGDAYMRNLRAACKASLHGKATLEEDALVRQSFDHAMSDQEIDSEGMMNLTVDLSATDEQLIADYKRCLTASRKALGKVAPQQNFCAKDFCKWFENGILPYIDLTLWARAHNISITQNALGEAIFPNEDDADTTERIRRTTKPQATYLLREETCRALEYQATSEKIAEKMSASPPPKSNTGT